MARYFGGFRDRLKKKSRNLSISEKDIEWLKVATSFSWSPAKREYQWLEPEDYLSSFLSSSATNDTEFGDIPASADERYNQEDDIVLIDDRRGDEDALGDNDSDYSPAYDFSSTSGEDSLHGVLADLPHIDEYKLEIVSALQRRGIHVETESIQVPDELAFHLNNYHEKGRSSLDSYELRARLQHFKKQVIESYEQLSTPPGGFQVFDEPGDGAPHSASSNGLDNLQEDEKFIVSSLDRLEASLREDIVSEEIPPADAHREDELLSESSNDSYSASFSTPPSSFADDSWLVLPIDSPPSQDDITYPEPLNLGSPESEDEIFNQPQPASNPQKKQEEVKKRKPLFKSSKPSGDNGLIKAFNNLKSNPENQEKDNSTVDPIIQQNELLQPSPLDAEMNPLVQPGVDVNGEQADKGTDFTLFNKKDKAENSESVRERKLFDGRRKATKDHRSEVKLPSEPFVEPKEQEQEQTQEEPASPVENRTEVKFPSSYRREVVLPGQEQKDPSPSEHIADKEPLTPPVSEAENTMVMDFINDAPPEEEVSLSDLLLKLRNDSDLKGNTVDGADISAEKNIQDESESLNREPESETNQFELDELLSNGPVETISDPYEELSEPLVDPLEALAKSAKSNATKKTSKVDPPPAISPVSIDDKPVREIDDSVEAERKDADPFKDENEGNRKDAADLGASIDLWSPADEKATEPVQDEVAPPNVEPFQNEKSVLDSKPIRDPESVQDREPILNSGSILQEETELKEESVPVPESILEEELPENNETMAQRRARYIEEERKKLYSLIGRLEQNAGDAEIPEEHPVTEEPNQDTSNVLLQETSESPEKEQDEVLYALENEEKVEEVKIPTDPAVSLMDYIDAVPDSTEEPAEEGKEVQHAVDFKPQINEVIDNLQQAEDKDITQPASNASIDTDKGLNAPLPRAEIAFSGGIPPTSRPVIPINEEEVVMPEAQNDEQVPTADVQEVIEQTEEETPAPVAEETKSSSSEEPAVQKPSMEFDQLGIEFENLLSVVECLAFAAEEPIPLKKVARIYSEVQGIKMPTEKDVLSAVDQLNESYEKEGRSFRIKSWGRGIRMATHPQYANYIRALYQDNRPKKLSRTLMETLSIIAYSQPTTKPEIDFVRGVDSDYAVRKLLELGLIDIVGRSEAIGRPLLYGTSERFLDQFGLSEIEALPKLREVEELLGDPAFQKERLHLLALEGLDDQNQNQGENKASEKEAALEQKSEPEGTEKQD